MSVLNKLLNMLDELKEENPDLANRALLASETLKSGLSEEDLESLEDELEEKNGIKLGRLSGISAHYVPNYLQKNSHSKLCPKIRYDNDYKSNNHFLFYTHFFL